MRVGILTFHLGPNHGGYQQAFCLWQHIRSLGHDAEIINYKNATLHADEKFRPLVYRRPSSFYNGWIKKRVFDRAYKDLQLSTKLTTDVNEIEWARYDAVVIGSDVVWDYSWERLGQDPVYFGHFGCDYGGKVISYAPSIGTVKPTDPIPDWVGEGLAKMDAISVRDIATAEMVKRVCGRESTEVVDPTWLDLEYREPVEKKKQLVVYAYHISDGFREAIVRYARKRGLEIIALGYNHRWADRNMLKLGPMEWLPVLRESEAVVAGTFHGTLYAMNMQCQFVTVLNERIMTRIEKPLRISGLQSRGLSDPENLEAVMQAKIDYRAVLDKLSPHVLSSREFLAGNLS